MIAKCGLNQTEQELGISVTTLKRLCRHFGIKSWPYRQIAGIDRSIVRLKAELEESTPRFTSSGDPTRASFMSSAISDNIKSLMDHRDGIVKVCMCFGGPFLSSLPLPFPRAWLLCLVFLQIVARRPKLSRASPFVSD